MKKALTGLFRWFDEPGRDRESPRRSAGFDCYILSFSTLSRRWAVALLSGAPLASSTETVV